ncbi:MAG TPA: MaoC family dehydratase [Pseudonocardiaceae bacterium]|jgi:acyl dehydratase
MGTEMGVEMGIDTDAETAQRSEPIVIHGVEGLRERAGQKIGTSDWVPVTQDDIDTFAKLTGDEQWIHVDPERASTGPFGTTVQHGFLTLGKSTGLLWSIFTVDGFSMILNYGLNRVRFPAPLRVGSRMRMHVDLADMKDTDRGVEVVYRLLFEVEGEEKPCCVADLVFRYDK